MRERLANKRAADTVDIVHVTPQGDQQPLTLSFGRYPDGRLAEVFVEVPYQQRKFATALLAKDVATLISIALQHGASVGELAAAMGRSEMNWLGKMVERPHTLCGTVLDAMASDDIGLRAIKAEERK
jgi:hypothetical protein